MIYGITVETLTEEQLDALAIINPEVAKVERERRVKESKFETLEEVCEVAAAAYCLLRPMYDNMRNTDVKKTITSSGIIEMLEKLIRTKGDEPLAEGIIATDEPAVDEKETIPGYDWFYVGGPAGENVELKGEKVVKEKVVKEDVVKEEEQPKVIWAPLSSEKVVETEIAPVAFASGEVESPLPLAVTNPETKEIVTSQDKLTEILNSIPVIGA